MRENSSASKTKFNEQLYEAVTQLSEVRDEISSVKEEIERLEEYLQDLTEQETIIESQVFRGKKL
jgi:TolA-binding protein